MGSRKQKTEGITWKGDPVECYNKALKKGDYVFYKSFVLNGEVYTVGDFALCNYKPGGASKTRICRLMTVFHSNEPWHADAKEKAVVRWYTWARDLESAHNPQRVKFDPDNEVIEDYRGIDVFIALKNLARKCRVVFCTEEDPIDVIRREKLNRELYFSCRYKIVFGEIEAIFGPDSEWGEKEVFATLSVHESPISSISDLKSPLKRHTSSSNDSGSPAKSVKLTPKMDQLSLKSPEQKKSVRRNLNESFGDVLSPEYGTPTLNYSIVSPSSQSKDSSVKIKLRLSQKCNPQVILESLKDEVVKSYLKSSVDESSSSSSSVTLRRSSRATQRKSYAELISPEKIIPIKEIHAEETPSKRIRRKVLGSPEKSDANTPTKTSSVKTDVKTPTKMSSIGRRTTKTPINYLETITPSTRRKSILKTATTDCVTPSKRVTLPAEGFETPKTGRKGVALPEEGFETPKTDRKGVATPRSARGSRLRQIKEGVITPSVQKREQGVQKGDTPLIKARSQLHVSHVPEALPCREKEFSDVLGFLEGKLVDGCGGCMYISGVPGTGKTATVTAVIRKLQEIAQDGDITEFDYVGLNGMRLTEPRQAYVEILKQLTGKTVLWEQAQSMLDNRFSKSKKTSKPVIMLVDELDVLCTKRQDVVYNLLDWPTKANTQLIVVTIANTMDLPERLLMGRVTSRLGLTRLTFQPYAYKQLQEIVSKRLEGLNTFNPDAVQLVARKVASVSGDARRALDICRRAAEFAEVEGDDTLVSMVHVNSALNAMITQPKVQAIKHCSRLEQLILQAVVAEVERTGVEETAFSNVYTMLTSLSTLDGFAVVSRTRAMEAVNKLGACRLLLTDQKASDINQRIILNVSADDVYFALRKD